MGKPEVLMRNWVLSLDYDEYNLSGIADEHYALGRFATISHTSKLIDYKFENDVLYYETMNTMYICPLKYICTKPLSKSKEGTNNLIEKCKNSDSILDRIILALAKQALNKRPDSFMKHILSLVKEGEKETELEKLNYMNHLCDEALKYEDSIYLELSNIENGDLLAFNINGHNGIVEPRVHYGTFRDSVLYQYFESTGEDKLTIDFRYFPSWFGSTVETYAWHDNIKQAVIKNTRKGDVEFNKTIIKPGEVAIFNKPIK